MAARRGRKRALVAVGHSLLVMVYHLLTQQTSYRELGEDYFPKRDQHAVQLRLVRRLENLGLKVTVEPAPQAV